MPMTYLGGALFIRTYCFSLPYAIRMIQLCLLIEKIMRQLKMANVVSLYKCHLPMMFNHDWTPYLLCTLSKVFEKVMYTRLNKFWYFSYFWIRVWIEKETFQSFASHNTDIELLANDSDLFVSGRYTYSIMRTLNNDLKCIVVKIPQNISISKTQFSWYCPVK